MESDPVGFLRRDQNRYFKGDEPYWLSRKKANEIAMDYMDFKMSVASNMQFSLISRRLIDRLSKDASFFRSPYPDFYATPLLFMCAEKILIYPKPMVIVGITPKSYGAFHGTNRVAEGVKFLGNEHALSKVTPAKKYMLPGTSYYDSWLLAMESLRHACDGQVRPNYRRYRFLQIVHSYKARYLDNRMNAAKLAPLRSAMTYSERILYGIGLSVSFTILRVMSKDARARIVTTLRSKIGQHLIIKENIEQHSYSTLLDVYEGLGRHNAP